MLFTMKEKIERKIHFLYGILDDFEAWQISRLKDRLHKTEIWFHQETIPLECEYDETNKLLCIELENKLNNIISNQNLLNVIDSIFEDVEQLGIDTDSEYVRKYKAETIIIKPIKYDYSKCENCDGHMIVELETCIKECQQCGLIESCNVIIDESQYYGQETIVVKQKKHDTIKHCKRHLHKIQAKENFQLNEELLEVILNKVKQEYGNRSIKNLTCAQIRIWFKNCRYKGKTLSYLNDNIPTIRKIITATQGEAIVPPQLTLEEEELLLNKYNHIMNLFDKIIEEPEISCHFKKRRRNKFYYPYFIYKILNIILEGDKRLPALLDCIHLQDSDTLVRNDIVWKRICQEYGFTYKPTY